MPVFFDVDGVLLDSLPQHLAICSDKAREFGLSLRVPDVSTFRRMIASGVKVSPMFDFFVAVGFPRELASRAVEDYDRDFARCYRPEAFAGIGAMLERLRRAGRPMGLVTANIAANVEAPLRDWMPYFDARCLFYMDRYDPPRSKSWCLAEGSRLLGALPDRCVFVGDQPADATAAEDAGWAFVGVSYGWGLLQGDPLRRIVDTPAEVADAILAT
jgi:phosphoglycolate phosphatase-like HAD superfamily hydrolase